MLSDTFAMLVRVMNKENISVEEEFNHKYSLKTLWKPKTTSAKSLLKLCAISSWLI